MLYCAIHEGTRMPSGWPETLIDVAEIIADEAGDAALARRIIRRLAREFGGQQIYIASPGTVERPDRDAEIRRTWDGTFDGRDGIYSIAARNCISRSTVRRIVHHD
jgi:Mor family transcriptional regulator